MNEALRCAHCGDVIGVYEPLIAIVDGCPREISRAAERELAEAASSCFHGACYPHSGQSGLPCPSG